MAAKSEFEKYLAQKLKEDEGRLVPVKASARERLLVKKADIKKLHPNPEDEFCDPAIGPNDRIIADYVQKIRNSATLNMDFVSPATHKTEAALPFPLNRIYTERLRLGAPDLIRELQKNGDQVWVYTSSFRSEKYIRGLFRCYGVKLDGIVNGQRHLREVQRDHSETLPQKLPNHYRISLHIDDEEIICVNGRQYGYEVYRLDAQDDDWKEKIIARADQIRKREAEREATE